MKFSSIIAVIFCLSVFQLCAAGKCTGPKPKDAQDNFKKNFDAASIVTYGTVTNVTNNVAKFQINCLLKGLVPVTELDLPQLSDEAADETNCHYLTASKNYIVFLQVIKPTLPDGKIIYGLLNMEEIEITPTSVNAFINEECKDLEDQNIDMTIFYYGQQRTCGKFETKCNDKNKAEILAMKHDQLTSATTFLAGFKNTLPVPTGSMDGNVTIHGKSSGGADDVSLRSAATLANIYMPILFVMIGFALLFKA